MYAAFHLIKHATFRVIIHLSLAPLLRPPVSSPPPALHPFLVIKVPANIDHPMIFIRVAAKGAHPIPR